MEGTDGSQESENATVVTSLSGHIVHSVLYSMKNQNMGGSSSQVLVLRPELNCLWQGEAALSKALLDHYLVPPPSSGLLREVVKEVIPEGTNGGSDSGVHQDQFLNEFIFKGEVKGGFFVEAGADNFLLNSNTLLFELLHGWTGLLVEPLLSQFQDG